MANPTTNYGFVLPTATDLVTDLPADFDVALQGVDTRLKALQPGTTLGDIAYSSATANTNTRLPIGTTGQVLAVSGGVPAWTTTSDVTPLTTKGDLFTFTTVDARLGIGANNTVLTADSAEATGMKWATPASGADNWVLISGQSVSAVSSVSFTGLSGYKKLFFACPNWFANTTGIQVYFRLNADSAANYVTGTIARSSDGKRNQSGAANEIIANFYAGTQTGMDRTAIGLFIDGCNGGGYKPYTFTATGNTASVQSAFFGSGIYKSTTNISSIDITLASGTITCSSGDGNEFQLWGVA